VEQDNAPFTLHSIAIALWLIINHSPWDRISELVSQLHRQPAIGAP
jgi:hypothetical protein